jgi:hypothetical protein
LPFSAASGWVVRDHPAALERMEYPYESWIFKNLLKLADRQKGLHKKNYRVIRMTKQPYLIQ